MVSRSTAILFLSCVAFGCSTSRPTGKNEPETSKVTIDQGGTSGAFSYTRGDVIEGEKDGVTAKVADTGFLFVSAAKDAKIGDVELTIKRGDNKVATILVTVREAPIDLKFQVLGLKRVTVWQNDQTVIEIPVVRRSEFTIGFNESSTTLAVTGKFRGDLKLSSEIVSGGKGLTVTFEPEIVKGSESKAKITFKAADNADLGELVVRLTATTLEGTKAAATVPLDVEVAPKKK